MAKKMHPKWVCRTVAALLFAGLGVLHPTLAMAQEDEWALAPDARVEFSVISAQSSTRDEQLVVDGDAFTVRAQVGLDFEDENTRFRLEADRIEVFRLGEGRRDTARDRFTATFQQELDDDWEIELRGRVYDDFVTAESSDTSETQGSVAVTYEPVREHRARIRATWREREYADGGTGEGPRVDAQYRHRFGRYHYLTFDLRAEEISSDDPDRGYERQSARVSYTQPITPDLRVRPAIEYIRTDFDARMTAGGEPRSDRLLVPEIEAHYWPGRWRIEAEAKYIFSSSNQPTREREGYRLTLSIGYAF